MINLFLTFIMGETPLDWHSVLSACAVTAIFTWLGVKTFRGMEKGFADVI